ncbi:MAG: hypothetical protein ACK559_36275, partial [bacterium]
MNAVAHWLLRGNAERRPMRRPLEEVSLTRRGHLCVVPLLLVGRLQAEGEGVDLVDECVDGVPLVVGLTPLGVGVAEDNAHAHVPVVHEDHVVLPLAVPLVMEPLAEPHQQVLQRLQQQADDQPVPLRRAAEPGAVDLLAGEGGEAREALLDVVVHAVLLLAGYASSGASYHPSTSAPGERQHASAVHHRAAPRRAGRGPRRLPAGARDRRRRRLRHLRGRGCRDVHRRRPRHPHRPPLQHPARLRGADPP